MQPTLCSRCHKNMAVVFINRIEGASAHDDLGATAMDGVRTAVSQFDNEEFTALWDQVKDEKENNRE